MSLPIPLEYPPMEASTSAILPDDDGWLYEPKWDGFRCLTFRDGTEADLRSKAGKPLGRYFPEVVESVRKLQAKRFVLDGELVIPVEGTLVFDELLLRIHPAESRVRALAESNPAHLILFDLLVDTRGRDRTGAPLLARRRTLEEFAASHLRQVTGFHLSPMTEDVETARAWLTGEHGGLDGVIAKLAASPYTSGARTGMVKVKRMRTAECVVGGFRWSRAGRTIGSLLLGLYGDDDKLDHVGFCSALNARVRAEADERILPLRNGEGFSGREPTGTSRWRREGSGEWVPVEPRIVVEVEYDHFSGGRFRHGTRFLRWRPDKPPELCRMEQVEREEQSPPAFS
jgi:ATP-dependent DNA ligase